MSDDGNSYRQKRARDKLNYPIQYNNTVSYNMRVCINRIIRRRYRIRFDANYKHE